VNDERKSDFMDQTKARESYINGIQKALGTTPIPPMIKKLRGKKSHVAVHEPYEELRKLVLQHKALIHTSKAANQMTKDRTVRRDTPFAKKGDILKCRLPDDARQELETVAKNMKMRAASLARAMKSVLKEIPIYRLFLKNVFGLKSGAVIAAYIVSEIDIRDRPDGRSLKPSMLRRFCGLAVIDGRLERKKAGQKNRYNAEMRMRLFQFCSSMWKNAAKVSEDRPYGTTSKYLEIWKNYKHRMQRSERYDVATNMLLEFGKEDKVRKGARAVIHATGWHKAADVFIEDLYIVWRAIEGLPVWPDYHAAKLGYSHGGRICVNAPRMISVAEALQLVDGYQGRAAEELIEDLGADARQDE
jgi:hypothetical protein